VDVDGQRAPSQVRIVSRRTGVIIAVSMVVANIANYGFQIIAGRFLSVEEYGLMAGFMAVVTVITVATSSVSTTAARAIAADEHDPNGSSLDGLTRSSLLVGGGLVLASLGVSPIASRFFNIGALPVILLGVYVLPSLLDSLALGRLQGLQRFSGMAAYSCLQAIAKLGVASIVLAVGLRASGLVAGLIASCAIVAMGGLAATRDAGAIDVHALAPEVRRAFAAFTMFWLMLGADVLFARAFFDETSAGLYGAASVLGKSVLWVPAVIAQLIFPKLAQHSKHGDTAATLVTRAVVLVGVVVAASVGALLLLGETLFVVLYGEPYRDAADTAWKIGLAVAPLALVNLLIQHFLARRQGRFLGAMLVILLIEVLSLYLGPKTTDFYSLTLAVTGVVLLVAMIPLRRVGHMLTAQRSLE
jgi:O-antigen/teichoic acid export membrane protein